ncbi:MAG: hypothetical protein V7637_6537 [Mycobacteriales bacterium]|jgi:hypothetical protein
MVNTIPAVTMDDVSALLGGLPGEPFPVDWAGVEARLGVGLPADYKAFGSVYGPVTVGGWLTVLVPRRAAPDYFADLDRMQGNQRVRRDLDPAANPYAFHPEPGGLLLWATTDGQVELFWDTGSGPDPDGWSTVAGTGDGWQPLPPMTTTQVLAALLRGELDVAPAARRPLPGNLDHRVWRAIAAGDEARRGAP